MLMGAFFLDFWIERSPEANATWPSGHQRWTEILVIGIAGVITGAAYWWFWHRFAVRKVMNRTTWHIGTGLIIAGGAWLLLNGWEITGIGYFLTLAVWTQGHTRQFFDRV